jgi:hypothetical protein
MLTITGTRKVPSVQGLSTAAAPAAAAATDGDGLKGSAADAVVFSQRERNFKRFVRSWVLPDDASSEGITAQVECGVLSIRVAKITSSSSSSGGGGDDSGASDVYGDE